MRLRHALPLLALAALAACGRADDAGETGPNGAIVPESEIEGVGPPPEGPAPAAPVADAPLDRMAGVRVGMTVADLRAAGFPAQKDDGPDPDNDCGYARIDGMKELFFMLDGDTVVRIDVATRGHPTLGGVEVGMSEAEALRRLGARAKVSPHPYTGPEGHYVSVHAAGDPMGLILETDGKSVLSYRIGRWEQVQWVEGCL